VTDPPGPEHPPGVVGPAGRGPGGPPRPFACLWCGRSWQPRSADDLEARARLCPDCLGRAGENPFLRFRLRAGLAARPGPAPGRAAPAAPVPARGPDAGAPAGHEDELLPYYEARAAEYDDWYLRRGRYAHGPVQDLAWQMELDAATTWLDGLPIAGEIVELAAGTGWWSALLATKGELHAYDAAGGPLDRARERLLAHRLRAHLHVRDAWEPADRRVDALFTGFWLSHVPRARLAAFLGLARGWLRPGGTFAAIDSLADPASGTVDRLPVPGPDLARRRLADGREFTIPKVHYLPAELADALDAAGFRAVDVGSTGRFFLLARAAAP
jgi:demethylmenaquinone methyltransferase/2-methoxy-6-polyprenyl-1,4-benzoquinol methylase